MSLPPDRELSYDELEELARSLIVENIRLDKEMKDMKATVILVMSENVKLRSQK